MTWAELLSTAGWTMAPIGLCSVVAATVFVFKVLQLRAARVGDWAWLEPALAAVEPGALARFEDFVASEDHPGARVLASAARTFSDRPSRAEAEARRVGSRELQALEAHLVVLAFVARVAPLLGLLGTVLGMVDLFSGLQGAGLRDVDVSLLSAGIWKALLTTAAGLTVALPTLAGHAWLAARTDRFRLDLEDAVERLVTLATPREAD